MKHSSSLPSALKIAAEVDAALAQAGLAGPQVEREAIPLYLSFIFEMTNDMKEDPCSDWNSKDVAQLVESWANQQQKPMVDVVKKISSQLREVAELCKIHGTLSDFKRRELFKYHEQIVDYLQQPKAVVINQTSRSL